MKLQSLDLVDGHALKIIFLLQEQITKEISGHSAVTHTLFIALYSSFSLIFNVPIIVGL
jgi:hypothetical protein